MTDRADKTPLRQRLLLPTALALLFVFSIAFSIWDMSRGPTPRVTTPPVPAPALGTPPASVTAPTTIIFACEDVVASYKDYAELARTFAAENPGLMVVAKSFQELLGATNEYDDYQAKMQEIAARADVFCVRDVASLSETYYLYDLTSLAASDATFHPEDFYEAVLDTGRYQERLFAIPSRFQPAIIRYNPAAFDAARLAHPRPGWTWQEFADDAVALTERGESGTIRWGFAEDAALVFSTRLLAAARDTDLSSAAGSSDPFGSKRIEDLFMWYERLYSQERAAPAPSYFEMATASFVPPRLGPGEAARRKAAMWTDLMYENVRRPGKPAPLPSHGQDEDSTPFLTNPSWAIAGETLYPDASWRWLSYLSHNPPPDPTLLRLPARRSLVEQSESWKDLPSDERETYRYILDHLMPLPTGEPATVTLALYGNLVAMVAGNLTLEQIRSQGAAATATERSDPSVRATIRFAVPLEGMSDYRALARAFAEETGIGVDLIASDELTERARSETTTLWGRMRQVANRADVLAGPDVVALVRSGRGEGILRDMTLLVASHLTREDFYPNTLESLEWRGRSLAVPARVSAYLVHYNRWMFDQNDVPYPQPGWTWDDFAQTAQAVTRRGQDNLWWYGAKDGLSNQLMLLTARTGPLVKYAAQPAQALLDRPSTVEAVGWYAALVRADVMMVPHALLPDIGRQPRYSSIDPPVDGAMWVAPADISALKRLRQDSIGTVPFPVTRDDDRTNPIEIVDAYAISASSEQVVAAWEWVRYLLDRQPAKDAERPGVPAQRAAVTAVGEDADADALRVYQFALEHARPLDALRPENYFAQRALNSALARVVLGEKSATDALEEAQRLAQSGRVP